MNPLKVKATGSPITSANISGLQTMTDAEVKNYIANVITEKFAAVTDGTGTAEINITTNDSGSGTSIGTFVDTTRNESIGTHPATGAVTTTTYTAKQVTAAAVESITNRPLAWDSRLEEMVDGDIDSTMDLCVEAMVAESTYTAGQYKLQATAPSGGTWVSRYTLTDTAQGGNTVTYLWQKTVASSSPTADLTPLRAFNGGNCKQMTEAEIEQMLPVFRNRIIETGIGTYKIQSDAPSGGTWVQTGNTFTDTREEITPQNYAGNFTGNFTGNFSSNYVGTANYSGSRTYSGNYAGNYGGTLFFSGSRNYSGTYLGSANFSGNYGGSRNYSGNYVGNYGGSIPYSGSRNYSGNYAGTGNFAGPKNYSGTYTGTGNFAGPASYSGSRTYSGNYAGFANYSGITNYAGSRTYSGTYAGPNFLSPEAPNYIGFYTTSVNYAGTYIGPGTPPASYTGYFMAETYSGGPYSGPTYYMGAAYTGFGGNFAAGNEPMGSFADFFSGSPGFYSGPGFQATQFIPGLGEIPVFYAGPSYTGVPVGAGYSGSRNYIGYYVGYYSAPNINYSGTFSGSRNYAGNYAGFIGFAGTVNYSGSRNYAGNYLGTENFVGPQNYSGNYLGTGNFAGPASYSGSRTYSGNYLGGVNFSGTYSGSRTYSGNYLGSYSGLVPYSGSRTYSGNYAGGGSFSGTYSGSRNYSGLYNGPANYSGNYSSAFSGNFTGAFSGATIQATKETVSSVKLWIRTA